MVWIFVAIAATFGGLKLYSDDAVRRFEQSSPPAGEFVLADSVRIHYVARGEGTPVVMLHGSDGVLQSFTYSLFDSVAAGFRAIAVDRPGHGYSDRPGDGPLTIEVNARLIHDAMKELGVSRPILVGHSYGGSVALRYAIDYPEDVAGLVLLAPGAYPMRPVSPLFYIPRIPLLGPLLVNTLTEPLGSLYDRAFLSAGFTPNRVPHGYRRAVAGFSARPEQFLAFAAESRTAEDNLEEMEPHYAELRMPVTILDGDDDTVLPPEHDAYPLHQAIPGSKLVMLPHTGHAVHLVHPEAVMRAIREVAGEGAHPASP